MNSCVRNVGPVRGTSKISFDTRIRSGTSDEVFRDKSDETDWSGVPEGGNRGSEVKGD